MCDMFAVLFSSVHIIDVQHILFICFSPYGGTDLEGSVLKRCIKVVRWSVMCPV